MPHSTKRIGNKGMIGVLSTERNNFSWQFIQSLLDLKTRMGSDVSITYAHSGTIPEGRNLILSIAKKLNCEYAIMVDSDMTFPSDGILRLKESMGQHDASIGCGLYFGYYPPYKSMPMAYVNEGDTHKPLTSWNEVKSIDSCGMGFTLITKYLFDIKFEFQPGKGEDYLFCTEAKKQGAKIVLDPSVKCGHLRTFAMDESFINKMGI